MPHPAALILLWVCFTVAMQSLHGMALLLAAGIPLAAIVLKLSAARFYTLLRRTRWIMVSLLLIYGYATPGEALWGQLGMFSPTQKGLFDGMLQLCRLIFALASLSVVLSVLSRQQLIGGLYALAYPLRYLGLSRERIAVRLALTLHYAESSMADTAADWRGSIEQMLAAGGSSHGSRISFGVPLAGGASEEIGQQSIDLAVTPFTLRDGLLLVAGFASLALVLL